MTKWYLSSISQDHGRSLLTSRSRARVPLGEDAPAAAQSGSGGGCGSIEYHTVKAWFFEPPKPAASKNVLTFQEQAVLGEAYAGRNDLRVAHAREVASREYAAPVMGRRWSDLCQHVLHGRLAWRIDLRGEFRMPIGCCSLIPTIATQFVVFRQGSVLDLGIGMGFYGAVVRQWLDGGVQPWRTRLVGVEGFAAYAQHPGYRVESIPARAFCRLGPAAAMAMTPR